MKKPASIGKGSGTGGVGGGGACRAFFSQWLRGRKLPSGMRRTIIREGQIEYKKVKAEGGTSHGRFKEIGAALKVSTRMKKKLNLNTRNSGGKSTTTLVCHSGSLKWWGPNADETTKKYEEELHADMQRQLKEDLAAAECVREARCEEIRLCEKSVAEYAVANQQRVKDVGLKCLQNETGVVAAAPVPHKFEILDDKFQLDCIRLVPRVSRMVEPLLGGKVGKDTTNLKEKLESAWEGRHGVLLDWLIAMCFFS